MSGSIRRRNCLRRRPRKSLRTNWKAQAGQGTQTQIEQLKAERDQLLDRLARLQAEFENARKRAERERAE